MTIAVMPAADAAAATNTQVLVETLNYLEGDARNIVAEILLSSLKVINVPMLTSRRTAELFTIWYNTGVLRDQLICIQPRAVYAEQAVNIIDGHLRRFEENIEELGIRRCAEEISSLRSMRLWITDPIEYMRKRHIYL